MNLRVENADTLFTNAYDKGQVIRVPVAHGDGRYTADERHGRSFSKIAARWRSVTSIATGTRCRHANPNGSMNDIAGIVNDRGNILGLMPHPEDAVDPLLGSTDGLGLFESILARVAA